MSSQRNVTKCRADGCPSPAVERVTCQQEAVDLCSAHAHRLKTLALENLNRAAFSAALRSLGGRRPRQAEPPP